MRPSIAFVLALTVGCAADGNADEASTSIAPVSSLLPARVRRLTNAEYDASVWALLGAESVAAVNGFPRDSTQKLGFTVNDAQIVSPVLAGLLDNAAESVVGGARQSGWLATLAPCAAPATQVEQCALEFIGAFAAKAYRRPLTPDDVEPLLAVFRAGAGDGGAYEQGVELVARAILQSPSFLYVTELGDGAVPTPSEELTLTLNETASLLAFSTTASPPDRTLLEDLGSLSTADGREQQARRLLATSAGRKRMVRFVREWLGIDGVAELGTDSNVYPSFASHRGAIAAESSSFIDDVLANGAGTLQELFGADWTVVAPNHGATDQEISAYYDTYYGLGSLVAGRTSLLGARGGARVGILNQPAFLARFASATASNPVLRGVALLRRLACIELPSPVELDIDVIPPFPDPSIPRTTRQLYAIHASDRVCAGCHEAIDSFGFAFEAFDGAGAFRTNREEAVRTASGVSMLPVETATHVSGAGADLDGDYADSNALARALSNSEVVRTCMARQIFRAATGSSDASVRGAEDDFVAEWESRTFTQRSSILETWVALVKSHLFVQRDAKPR
jgi:hypothetical protein